MFLFVISRKRSAHGADSAPLAAYELSWPVNSRWLYVEDLFMNQSKNVRGSEHVSANHTAPTLSDSAVIAVLKSAQSVRALTTSIDPEVRRQLVATEAYFLAERRGFAAGHELEDWVAAEAAVDSRRQEMKAA